MCNKCRINPCIRLNHCNNINCFVLMLIHNIYDEN